MQCAQALDVASKNRKEQTQEQTDKVIKDSHWDYEKARQEKSASAVKARMFDAFANSWPEMIRNGARATSCVALPSSSLSILGRGSIR